MATKKNLIIDQGSDYSFSITITGQDYTGFSARGQIRKTYDSDVIASFTAVNTEANIGKFTLSLAHTVTAAMAPGKYLYDIEVYQGSTSCTRMLEGEIELTPEVTK